MKAIVANENFNPLTDIGSLDGKVIFITGGTGGLGAQSAKDLAAHNPAHIYITGRNRKAGEATISAIASKHPSVGVTFVQMDLSSLANVKEAVRRDFKHDRLDILMNNAGIMCHPAILSKDGYEIQFATNHLGHAMVTDCLLPTLLRTAKDPAADVRILNLTSEGHAFHPTGGISFKELNAGSTMSRWFMGGWIRYGQSKLANILFSTELSRKYPQITTVAVHPGVVKTGLVDGQTTFNMWFISFSTWIMGVKHMEVHQGAWNQLWCAAAATKEELVTGGYYYPVGAEQTAKLDKFAKSEKLAKELWDWTEGVLAKF